MKNIAAAIIVATLTVAGMAHAQTRYITDVTYVPIRSGPGNQFRILHHGLKSGTRMTLLETPADSDWSKVKTSGGIEGWVRTQYLISDPTAQQQLNETRSELNATRQEVTRLTGELSALQSEHTTLNNQAIQLTQERDQCAEELRELKTLSADAVNLNQRYQDLLAKHEMMNTEFDAVRAENDRLRSDKTISQWLFGAGLLFAGMILMIILPRLKPKKRHSDWAD